MKQLILKSQAGNQNVASDQSTDSYLVQAALRNDPAAFRNHHAPA